MDEQSQGAHDLLAALADCNDALRTFAYDLYLRHPGSSWGQSLVISGQPFTISTPESRAVYERCYIPSVSLHLSPSKSIAFNLYLCFDQETWMVAADIEVNDNNADETEYLWESGEKHTATLKEAIAFLRDASQQLIHRGETLNLAPS